MVFRGGGMTQKTLQEASDYLTVIDADEIRRIIDIAPLLRRHSEDKVITFLDDIYKEKQRKLKDLIERDKTDSEIDVTIAQMFRFNMAIKALKKSKRKEVKKAA